MKDELEPLLPTLVCCGHAPLAIAQRDMATDWVAAYKKYFTDRPLHAYSSRDGDDGPAVGVIPDLTFELPTPEATTSNADPLQTSRTDLATEAQRLKENTDRPIRRGRPAKQAGATGGRRHAAPASNSLWLCDSVAKTTEVLLQEAHLCSLCLCGYVIAIAACYRPEGQRASIGLRRSAVICRSAQWW